MSGLNENSNIVLSLKTAGGLLLGILGIFWYFYTDLKSSTEGNNIEVKDEIKELRILIQETRDITKTLEGSLKNRYIMENPSSSTQILPDLPTGENSLER